MTLASMYVLCKMFLERGVPGNNPVLAYDRESKCLRQVTGLNVDQGAIEVETHTLEDEEISLMGQEIIDGTRKV